MSTTRPFVTVMCDACPATLPTARTTTAGARGDATRKGWLTAVYGDGYHARGESADPHGLDRCPACNPNKPKPPQSGPDLFGTPTDYSRLAARKDQPND